MNLVELKAMHAFQLASLWLSGVEETALSDEVYLPAVSQEQYSEIIAARLASGAVFGWGIVCAQTHRLAAYLTAELKAAPPEFVPRRYLSLLDLDVHKAERRKGFGARLVDAAKCYSVQQSLSSIEVNWVGIDTRASEFWHRQGFGPYLSRGSFRNAR